MGVTVPLILSGTALVTAGAFLLAGAWALVACGIVILAAGLLVDWEKAS